MRKILVFLMMIFLLISLGNSAVPKRGGTLVFGRGGDSVKLDPINVTDGESLRVTHQIFDTLVKYKPNNTEVVPNLATSWTVSKDGKVWTFRLRKNVKFHDGTDFDAEAVKFNFDRWMDEKNPYHVGGEFEYWGYMFGGFPGVVKSVTVVDKYTIRFTLERPLAPFLSNLAMPCFAIASPTAIKKYGEDFFKNPVGTGAFKFVSWTKGDKIVLEANKNYWDGAPYLDRIIFRSIPDNSARFMELEAGTIDIMDGVNPEDVEKARQNPNLQVILRPSLNVGYLAMNMDKKPFDDVRVRLAINYAINKKTLVEAFFGKGLAMVAKNPIPPSLWGYNDKIEDYPYDPAKAKELLKEAGYPNGFKTTLWAMPVPRPYNPQPRKLAEAVQGYLKAVGIDAEIVTFDWGTYLQKTENGEHDMAFLGWTGDNGDPDNFFYVLLDKDNAVKGSAGNIAFYRSDELHEILVKAQTITDKKERTKLYEKACEIVHRDAPWVIIAHTTPPVVAKKTVHNYIPHPTGSEPLYKVWKE
ncbi:MAG: ABC transporter substrate-binding protein [Dictyoglomus sp. NZ13-RE01]|nr:MAG: ABC transporter substrate-binding protein [Dictyoglomus sp. NZ13-RE01]